MPSVNLRPTHNALVDSGQPDTNLVGLTSFAPDGADGSRVWMKFDLSSIPAGATITSATLHLRNIEFGHDFSGYTTPVDHVRRSTNISWDESTITWNNAPSVDGTDTSTFAPDMSGATEFYTSDATAAVSTALASGALSLRIHGSDGGGAVYQRFWSKEGDATYPYLEVNYVAAWRQLPSADCITTGWTATPLFSKVNDSSDATSISNIHDTVARTVQFRTQGNGGTVPDGPYRLFVRAQTLEDSAAILRVKLYQETDPCTAVAELVSHDFTFSVGQPLGTLHWDFTIDRSMFDDNSLLINIEKRIDGGEPVGVQIAEVYIEQAPAAFIAGRPVMVRQALGRSNSY